MLAATLGLSWALEPPTEAKSDTDIGRTNKELNKGGLLLASVHRRGFN